MERGMRRYPMARRLHSHAAASRIRGRPRSQMRDLFACILLCLLATGCGKTLVLRIPSPLARTADLEDETDPRAECEFMTILIDYSRNGMGLTPEDVRIAARVADAMESEFAAHGTHVTQKRGKAYWSLMILAANNERSDGYIFSALLASRSMSEGYDPGVAVYAAAEEVGESADAPAALPSMYNGLSYGPYENLEDQAREYVRRAYKAVFPTAKQLCEFAEADRQREEDVDGQLPDPPVPL